MSKLLDALIELRRKGAVSYKEYLERIAKLTRETAMPGGGSDGYPEGVRTAAQRALYNNLGRDEGLALAVDAAIQSARMDGWRAAPLSRRPRTHRRPRPANCGRLWHATIIRSKP